MPVHFEPHGLHVDAADLMEIGQHYHPAIKDDLAPSKAGAYQRDLTRGAFIQPRRNHDNDGDEDNDQKNNRCSGHHILSFSG